MQHLSPKSEINFLFYGQENLDEIFKGKVVPKMDENDSRNDIAAEMVVNEDHVCITPWNLIPEKYFHFYSPKSFACSYLTTVPVWCYLADGLLKQLDKYIEVITQVSEPTLLYTYCFLGVRPGEG